MSIILRPRITRLSAQGQGASTLSARGLATILTGGAAVLALILATAIPAKADKKDDLAKALIAAVVIGAIANELKAKPEPVPVPLPIPVKHPRVPSVCAISIDGVERSVTLYPESCLRAEGFNHTLPRGCANGASIFGERDRVYSAQCLRDAGFKVSGQ